MSPQQFFTIGQLAIHFREPTWKVRRIVDALGVEIPRLCQYRLIPASILEEIGKRLGHDETGATGASQ